ncbi:MAG: VOC family protein, partial [Actinomycetota bacterium]|nr:VOC family protein [Actinomycetota bacterium]
MLDHLALQVRDVDAAAAFYARAFSALRVREAMRLDHPEGAVVGLSGADQFPHLWLGPLVDPGVRPVHLALTAPSREAV